MGFFLQHINVDILFTSGLWICYSRPVSKCFSGGCKFKERLLHSKVSSSADNVVCISCLLALNMMCFAERSGNRLPLDPSSTGPCVPPSLFSSCCCSSCSCPAWFQCRKVTPAAPLPITSPGPSTPCCITPTAHRPLDCNIHAIIETF